MWMPADVREIDWLENMRPCGPRVTRISTLAGATIAANLSPRFVVWKSSRNGASVAAHITSAKSDRCQASKKWRGRVKDYWSECEESANQEIAVSIRNAPTNEGRDQQSVGHQGVAAETDQEHPQVVRETNARPAKVKTEGREKR
jgi:hypothetical protein